MLKMSKTNPTYFPTISMCYTMLFLIIFSTYYTTVFLPDIFDMITCFLIFFRYYTMPSRFSLVFSTYVVLLAPIDPAELINVVQDICPFKILLFKG